MFLDVKPGTSAEIERQSPFFAMNSEVGETSTPIVLLGTERNARELELQYQYYTRRTKSKYSVEVYDGNTFRCQATLIVETGRLHINHLDKCELTGYLLFGISDFFNQVKGKKLSDLSLGGARQFEFTVGEAEHPSNGYWQHFHKAWTDGSIPYVFQPVRNEEFFEGGDIEWVNRLNGSGKLSFDFKNPIVPMIRNRYLMEQIYLEHGWTPDFSAFTDDVFDKLIWVNLTPLNWVESALQLDGTWGFQARKLLTIDLSQHVPQGKTISDFILQVFRRWGWAPVFNLQNKTVRLVAVKGLPDGKAKDWTGYAEPLLESSFAEDQKTYAFITNIDENDSLPSAPDFENAKYVRDTLTSKLLPQPTVDMEGRIVFSYLDNAWYRVELDDSTNQYEWVFYGDNIYSYEPEDNDEQIETAISSMPVAFTQYRQGSGGGGYGYFPIMKHDHRKPISYRSLIYHGLVPEMNEHGAANGTIEIPVATSTSNPGAIGTGYTLEWANVYKYGLENQGTIFAENGIIKYWWQEFLDMINGSETVDIKLHLPRHVMDQYQWDDVILVNHLRYLVKSMTEPIPFTGFLVATMQRIEKVRAIELGIQDTATGLMTKVYAQLTVHSETTMPTGLFIYTFCMVRISLFKDQNASIPYLPTSTIVAVVRTEHYKDNVLASEKVDNYPLSNSSTDVVASILHVKTGGGLEKQRWDYSLDPSPANEYVVV